MPILVDMWIEELSTHTVPSEAPPGLAVFGWDAGRRFVSYEVCVFS